MAEEKWKFFEKTLAKYPDRVYSVEENKIPIGVCEKEKSRTTERKTYDGTVQCNRYELRRLPDPCRKSRVKGTRCHILRSQPSDKFHGRGGNGSPAEIIAAVENAGYGASKKGEKGSTSQSASTAEYEEMLKDKETPVMKRRLVSSVLLLIPLMYFSMGHMMWGWPLPKFFEGNHIAMGLVQLLLTIAVMVINQKFFISGFKSLWHRAPNMDTLVALGSMASFIWSVYALFAMTRAQVDGDSAAVMNYMMEFYFESAAMILTLITVGKMLEARSKGKTTDALKSLMKLAPKTAIVLKKRSGSNRSDRTGSQG